MKNFVFALLFCVGKIILGQESDKIMIHKGNQSYKKQDFDRASYYYIEAIKKNNNDFKALYNLGNSLYKKGIYADAINEYQNALKNTQNRHEQKITLYNMGNAQFSKLNQENTKKEQERNKEEEEFIKKIEEKERNTAHRTLNHKGYSTIRNNEKDW